MERKKFERYSKEFREQAVERMNACDNITKLAQELGVVRHQLYREEIYASAYRDFDDLHQRLEEFLEQYYNRCRLHSALGYRSPESFENRAAQPVGTAPEGATVTFFDTNQG